MTTPRYLTPRRSRYGFGAGIEQTARSLGRPLMPWQVQAARRIGETDADGRILNPLVVITVPRQSGKSYLMWVVMLHRMFLRVQARVWYTAQWGQAARDQITELIDTLTLSSAWKNVVHCKRGAGETSIRLKAFGSDVRAFAPTGDSLHGKQSDLVVVDEGWFFDQDAADLLMGAIKPTQVTRPNSQVIVVSTMGTAASTWFHELVEAGRRGDPGVCLIDYGVAGDVAPDDFEAIYAAHPSADLNNFTMDKLREGWLPGMSAGEYIRAYGNRPTAAFDRLVPVEYTELATTTDDLPAGEPAFGAAVSFERDEAAIVACTLDAAGLPWLEVIELLPSVDGLAGQLATLTKRNGGHVVIDTSGPAASLADDAERDGATVTRVGTAEHASATVDMLDRLRRPMVSAGTPPGVRLRAHPAFTDALDAAALRTVGDRQVLARRGSAAPIAVLEAAVLAIRAAHNKPEAPVAPQIWI